MTGLLDFAFAFAWFPRAIWINLLSVGWGVTKECFLLQLMAFQLKASSSSVNMQFL